VELLLNPNVDPAHIQVMINMMNTHKYFNLKAFVDSTPQLLDACLQRKELSTLITKLYGNPTCRPLIEEKFPVLFEAHPESYLGLALTISQRNPRTNFAIDFLPKVIDVSQIFNY
jgi:hypothetical protein